MRPKIEKVYYLGSCQVSPIETKKAFRAHCFKEFRLFLCPECPHYGLNDVNCPPK